eukprot:scaffold58701_cov51-Phaeocystis_antarctica.AAC.1
MHLTCLVRAQVEADDGIDEAAAQVDEVEQHDVNRQGAILQAGTPGAPEPALNVFVHGPPVGLEVGAGKQPSDDHRSVRPADRL